MIRYALWHWRRTRLYVTMDIPDGMIYAGPVPVMMHIEHVECIVYRIPSDLLHRRLDVGLLSCRDRVPPSEISCWFVGPKLARRISFSAGVQPFTVAPFLRRRLQSFFIRRGGRSRYSKRVPSPTRNVGRYPKSTLCLVYSGIVNNHAPRP
jgi:hypothetical protein